jgi:hypothetical protein
VAAVLALLCADSLDGSLASLPALGQTSALSQWAQLCRLHQSPDPQGSGGRAVPATWDGLSLGLFIAEDERQCIKYFYLVLRLHNPLKCFRQ